MNLFWSKSNNDDSQKSVQKGIANETSVSPNKGKTVSYLLQLDYKNIAGLLSKWRCVCVWGGGGGEGGGGRG